MRRTDFLSSEGAGQMRDIIARYVADDNNLRDYEGRYKSYPQIVRDFKGLVSRKYIARIHQRNIILRLQKFSVPSARLIVS